MKKVLLGLVIVLVSGCSTSLTLETRRIDEYQSSEKMHDRPWKCWFVSCADDSSGS